MTAADAVAVAGFWTALGAIVYAYAGYPALLSLVGRFRPQIRVRGDHCPSVSIVIPVHNEESVIEEKLRNTLDADYPRDRLEIVVVSDGCTDATETIVSRHGADGVRLVRLPDRVGKARALNAGLAELANEVVVFTDASILLDRRAIREIVAPFAEVWVGCVSGEDHIPGGGGEGLYGRYELYLRNLESRVGSIVGASGCFYAQRRSLCRPFLEGMAPDFLSVLSTVEQGRRAITRPEAFGRMRSVASAGREFRRKIRTMLRGMAALGHHLSLLNPFRYGWFSIQLWSHKVLRWVVPLLMVAMAASSVALFDRWSYAWFVVAQGGFYGLAILGWLGPRAMREAAVFRIPFFFCMVNVAAAVAAVDYARGRRLEIWEPTRR